jgi:integrase
MSVYRRRDAEGRQAPLYTYDFWFNGRRFFGSTGRTSRKAAEEVERLKRAEAAIVVDEASIKGAFARFWLEVGCHDSDGDTTFYRLEALQDGLTAILAEAGKAANLSLITENELARYIAARRATIGRNGRCLSPASVNREIQILRRVMRRAVLAWKHDIRLPDWRQVLLGEPEEHVVDIADSIEVRILARMRADYRPALRFLVMSGLRTGSVLASPGGHGPLRPEAVDFEASVITVRMKSKKPGGRTLRLPMTLAMRVLIANEIDKHPDAIFTYARQRATPTERRGARVPITQSSFYSEFKSAAAAIGRPDLRPHDLRHTAANRLLGATGNLRLAQQQLGHTRVSTTQKYTHPDIAALRAGMEVTHDRSAAAAQSPTKSPAEVPARSTKAS